MKEAVYIGADHAGFELKEKLKKVLISKKYNVQDLGAHWLDKNDDYPDYAVNVATAVSKHKSAKGILLCGSSQGMCIAANKIKGIRAVTSSSVEEAKLTRQHNDANVLCLSGWNAKDAKDLTLAWLKTPFSKEVRHVRRLKKIEKLE